MNPAEPNTTLEPMRAHMHINPRTRLYRLSPRTRRVRGRQRSNRVCSPHPALLHLPRAPQTWKPLPSSVCLPYTNNTPTPSPRLAVYSLLLVMPTLPRRCLRCSSIRAREVRCGDAQLQLHASRHSHPRADARKPSSISTSPAQRE